MKKIYIIITLVISTLLLTLNIKASTFNQTTNQVTFGDVQYNVLASPFASNTTFTSDVYRKAGPYLNYLRSDEQTISTPSNSLYQYNYFSLSQLFENYIRSFDEYSELHINPYYLPNEFLFYTDLQYSIRIDYTFTTPTNIIANINTNGWFQVTTTPVAKVSLFIYSIIDSNTSVFFTSYYLNTYDVYGGLVYASGSFGGSGNMWIGLAYYDTGQVEYNKGYQDGLGVGKPQGYDEGYKQGLLDASTDFQTWYDNGYNLGYDTGYSEGANANLSNSFKSYQYIMGFFFQTFAILNIEVLPNLKLGWIVGVPLFLGLLSFIIGTATFTISQGTRASKGGKK